VAQAALLFGLGNPGPGYATTRHNAGFQVLDRLAERARVSFRTSRFLDGETADLEWAGTRVRLVKPASYMNLVGPVYRRALEVFEVAADRALAVSDDFALPFGRIRARAEGTSGGQKGLRSIEETLGSTAYPRLRLGIGPVPPGLDPADFVLSRYGPEERKILPDLLDRAADACLLFAAEGIEAVMNRYNAA
jgi:PTH1 family peptidyl-tRNA hydrolase